MPHGIINDMEKYFSMSTRFIKKCTCQCGKNILRILFLAHTHDDKFMK
jgi:hypothetical protein